jgi:ABC transporter DrrB family efflux protein
MTQLLYTFADGSVVAKRNLIKIKRVPDLIVFTTLSPIMFVLLFGYVFGSAIDVPGGVGYREFLMAGIFAQTVIFGATITGAGLAEDMQKGIIDRFRSLPMARSAVLTGRSLSDVVYNGGIVIVLMLTGLVVGWSVRTGFPELLAGYGLLLLFAFAMSWLGIWLGLGVPSVEVAQQVVFTVLFPITFISSAFVPPQTLPEILQPIAEWNPTSTLAASLRELWGNPNPFAGDSFPSQNPILVTLIWVVVFVAVFGPLGVRRYRSMNR